MDQAGTGEIRCQNCGHDNPADATYCENCGARLRKDLTFPPQYPTTEEPQRQEPANAAPPPYQQPVEQPEADWRMSSLGPPPQRKRRVWLWILIGILIACILICVVLVVLSALLENGSAPGWLKDAATNAAQRATEQSK